MFARHTEIAQLLLLCCIVLRSYILCDDGWTQLIKDICEELAHRDKIENCQRLFYPMPSIHRMVAGIPMPSITAHGLYNIERRKKRETERKKESEEELKERANMLIRSGRDIKLDSGDGKRNYVRVAQGEISRAAEERDRLSEKKDDLGALASRLHHSEDHGAHFMPPKQEAPVAFNCNSSFSRKLLRGCAEATAAKSIQRKFLDHRPVNSLSKRFAIGTSRDNDQKAVQNNSSQENVTYVYAYYPLLRDNDRKAVQNNSSQKNVTYVYAYHPMLRDHQTVHNTEKNVMYVYAKPYDPSTSSPVATSPDNHHRTVENNSAPKITAPLKCPIRSIYPPLLQFFHTVPKHCQDDQ